MSQPALSPRPTAPWLVKLVHVFHSTLFQISCFTMKTCNGPAHVTLHADLQFLHSVALRGGGCPGAKHLHRGVDQLVLHQQQLPVHVVSFALACPCTWGARQAELLGCSTPDECRTWLAKLRAFPAASKQKAERER